MALNHGHIVAAALDIGCTNIYICMIARTSTIGIVYCTGTVCGLRLGKQNIRAGHLRQLSRQSEPVLRGNILNELANQISYGI